MSQEFAITDVIPNDQPQAEIFKLKIDHFEELFDYLSLEHFIMLAKTCKRMQLIVGFYIKTNYAGIQPYVRSGGIHATDEATEDDEPDEYDQLKLDVLSSFLKRLTFPYLEHIEYDWDFRDWGDPTEIIPHMHASNFTSLKEILITRGILNRKGISRIKEIMGQLETVKFNRPYFVDDGTFYDFYYFFLYYCTNIKKLFVQVRTDEEIFDNANSWLLKKYPTLEHFELALLGYHEFNDLQTFFEQNMQLKSFGTSIEIMLANKNIFVNTQLKLDVLSIQTISKELLLKTCRDLLNELYDRGLFKQLHVYCFKLSLLEIDQEAVKQLVSYNGLTKLYIEGMTDGTDLSPLINLTELCINKASYITNMKTLAETLVNLKSIQFIYASADDILPLILYASKLNTIVVFRLGENFENVLKIVRLNEERSKLANAKKVNIYVEERVYLAMKWTKNGTNCSLIEIKRGTSIDGLNHNFDYNGDIGWTSLNTKKPISNALFRTYMRHN